MQYTQLIARHEIETIGAFAGKIKTVFYQGTRRFCAIIAGSKQPRYGKRYITLNRVTYELKWARNDVHEPISKVGDAN